MKRFLLFLQAFTGRSGALKKLWISLSIWYFNRSGQGIYNTPPVSRGDADLAVVTLLQTGDVVMYLHAIKSFARYAISPSEVHVINDGSLTEADKTNLTRQIETLHIHDIGAIDVAGCPTGGCWERLKYVVELSQRIYTIQLDADTLALGPLREVADAVKSNQPFLLGTPTGTEIVSTEQAHEFAVVREMSHVQNHSEREMKNLTTPQNRYIRASAGFAGFARGAVSWQDVVAFSQQMERLIVHDNWSWSSWGTEQVASNFVLANTENPLVLVEPDYVNHGANPSDLNAKFLHFIGTNRFTDDIYRGLAKKFAEQDVVSG